MRTLWYALAAMVGMVLTSSCQVATQDATTMVTKFISPPILSGYQSMRDPGGYRRPGAHAGVDIGAPRGRDVLAAADGEVYQPMWASQGFGCGNGVVS